VTIRDLSWSFTDVAGTQALPFSIISAQQSQVFLAPNSIDTAPLGTALTELLPGDTVLSAGTNLFRDLGGGEELWLCINWTQPPVGAGATIDVQLVTAATKDLTTPVVLVDFGAQSPAALTGPSVYGGNVRQLEPLPRSVAYQRFLGLQISVSAPLTAGAFVAWIGMDVDSVMLGYDAGYSVK
jgi:hypothetical protein